ncbi:Mitochondrial oxaloacetate carrier protein [Coelomomyces lativittatus]|nr:Mitochondrial oxaloacetate carrier protein [Coelomomyces lativittatus]
MLQNDFVLGATASCMAVTFTNPWEVIKTRFQLQNELCRVSHLTPRIYRNAWQAFTLIYQREGVYGLQRGLMAAYGYQMLMNGTRLGCYPTFYSQCKEMDLPSWLASMLSGFVCGLMGALVASPLYLIKSRMQASSNDPYLQKVGIQRNYKGVMEASMSIFKHHGFLGLWKGVSGSMLRTGVGSTAQLSSYEALKRYYIDPTKSSSENQVKAHLQASLITGLIVTLCMNPFDVVTTRLYNQHHRTSSHPQPNYRGPFHALSKILRTEGFSGLYKGVTAHWFRVGYVSYETVRIDV